MTRINAGIPPRQLSTPHLIAEHREIKRIPNHLKKFGWHTIINKVPKEFILGSGHVLFFIDKGLYTLNRYKRIHAECLRRNINVQDYTSAWDIYKANIRLFRNWTPTIMDAMTVRQRILDKTNLPDWGQYLKQQNNEKKIDTGANG
jgi:hypothetical protein